LAVLQARFAKQVRFQNLCNHNNAHNQRFVSYFRNMQQSLSHQQLVEIAHEFGTPVYVYHAERIAEQYNKLKNAFKDSNARFFYACKSLTNVNVLKYINSLGASLDCVSIHEVRLGLMAGFEPKNILFTPNCVDFDEIVQATGQGLISI
jgi:diaminopimelate decarboxylase